MSLEKRTKVINGRTYHILQPLVLKAMPLSARVTVALGAVLPSLVKSAKQGGMERFGKALSDVDPEKLNLIFMDAVRMSHLTCGTIEISDDMNFEKHFGEYRGDVYQVCIWALWECVKDFFPNLDGFMSKAMAKMEMEFPSQTDGQ